MTGEWIKRSMSAGRCLRSTMTRVFSIPWFGHSGARQLSLSNRDSSGEGSYLPVPVQRWESTGVLGRSATLASNSLQGVVTRTGTDNPRAALRDPCQQYVNSQSSQRSYQCRLSRRRYGAIHQSQTSTSIEFRFYVT